MEHLLTIEVLGQSYKFKTGVDHATARKVADLVVQEIGKVHTRFSDIKAALNNRVILILAALNIAEEYIEIKKDYSELVQNITKRSNELVHLMEFHFQ